MPLTTSELEGIQDAFETETLQDTATIERRQGAPDGQGGKTNTWSVVATGVPARIGPGVEGSGGAEGSIAGRSGASTPIFVNLPAGQDVTLLDRITILGRVLEVVELDARRSWEFTCKCSCREVT